MSVDRDQPAGLLTPGLYKIKGEMEHLDLLGHVNRYSLPKHKRSIDREFERWYAQQGKDIQDIPIWRNTEFTGQEAYAAFAKYNHQEPALTGDSKAAFDMATSWMSRHFGPYMSDSVILSANDVIDRTDGSGSPGYPWNKTYRTCEAFYEGCEMDYIDDYWAAAETPTGAFCVWNSFLKEELRKKDKILNGDIRQINGCPVEFKIAMNRLCLDMNEKFYTSHLNTASAVGINKFRGGWNRLYNKLNRFEEGFALDVKRWDSHFPAQLFERIAEFRFQCLDRETKSTPGMRQRFMALYEQIICSPTVMPWGEVLRTRLGNPSGSPNTVVDNTLGLFCLVAYSWIRSHQDIGEEPDYVDFQSRVALALYGDDNTFTSDKAGLERLSPVLVKHYGAELGFVVTAPSDVSLPVMQLDFLSSCFVKLRNGMVVPKPKDQHKARASMAFRGDKDILATWSRACAHRINSFWDDGVYQEINSFAKYLMAKLDAAMPDDIKWVERKPEYLAESSIRALYTVQE